MCVYLCERERERVGIVYLIKEKWARERERLWMELGNGGSDAGEERREETTQMRE